MSTFKNSCFNLATRASSTIQTSAMVGEQSITVEQAMERDVLVASLELSLPPVDAVVERVVELELSPGWYRPTMPTNV